MRWVLGCGGTSVWKVMRPLGGDREKDVEKIAGQENVNFCQQRNGSSVNTLQNGSVSVNISIASPLKRKAVTIQHVSESVSRVAQEVSLIREEVRKVRSKVESIGVGGRLLGGGVKVSSKSGNDESVTQKSVNFVQNKCPPKSVKTLNSDPTTEDEADSIRSNSPSPSSSSKTGSEPEVDVDSGLELGGGAFSLERGRRRPITRHLRHDNDIIDADDILANQKNDEDVRLQEDRWRKLFDKYDTDGFGEITWPDFFAVLNNTGSEFWRDIPEGKRQLLQHLGMIYSQETNAITFQCFVNIMSGKRSRSFKCAVHHRDREVMSENDFHILKTSPAPLTRMARLIADEFLTEERDRKYYADHYRCLPPPLFIISVTLIELGFFTYYSLSSDAEQLSSSSGPLPMDSAFVYRPDKREEVWRFLVYMVLHAGWVHLMFNLLVQLLVGLPLEMVHGSFRIGTIYMAGVLAGSLATSVFDPDVYLVGASGGVYALLAAHLANVLLNYNNMEFGILRLLGVFLIASVDVGFAIYDRYAGSGVESPQPVSYVAHLAGALAGLTIGLVVLKNFEQRLREQCMWWVALGLYAACTLFAVLFNLLRDASDEVGTEFVDMVEPFPHPVENLVNSF